MSATLHVTEDGNWLELLRPQARGRADAHPGPALFLDRDGTVIREIGDLHEPEKVELIPGAGRIIAAANRAGWPVVIVTNQSGVGRGVFTWENFAAVQAAVTAALAAEGAAIDMVLACAYRPETGLGRYRAAHPWRKPGPGMLLTAAKHLSIELGRSWILGDNVIDIEAGREAGLAGGLHVLTGHGETYRARALAAATTRYRVFGIADIAAAPRHIPELEA
jgi:D-glycero-D-manno-heptose 1,7-bisphosphate phosphatase